jgi:hypothetical protein
MWRDAMVQAKVAHTVGGGSVEHCRRLSTSDERWASQWQVAGASHAVQQGKQTAADACLNGSPGVA